MAKALVFVSSNIEQPENFLQERRAAKATIESFPCFDAWIFEAEGASSETLKESYLNPLRDSAIVVFVLGEHLADAVEREYAEAKLLEKRILIFLKSTPVRDQRVVGLIAAADVKYAQFSTIDDFQRELAASLTGEVVRALTRPFQRQPASRTETKLRQLLATSSSVLLRPTFPTEFNVDQFRIESLDDDLLTVRKGSGHGVVIPLDDITVGPVILNQPTILQLKGRNQWLSNKRDWAYIPEAPTDGYGVPKSASPGDARVQKVQSLLLAYGKSSQWNFEGEATAYGYQVVYDDDGYYFRNKSGDRRGDRIFVVRTG